jgi:hypothetical protein
MAQHQVEAGNRPELVADEHRRGGVQRADQRRQVVGLLADGRAPVRLGRAAVAVRAPVVHDAAHAGSESLECLAPDRARRGGAVHEHDRLTRAALLHRQRDAAGLDRRRWAHLTG